MSKKYALVQKGFVSQILTITPEVISAAIAPQIAEMLIACDDSIDVGYAYANAVFSPPAPLTPDQAVIVIHKIAYGKMEALYTFTDAAGALVNRRESVTRYGIYLNAIVTTGGTLSAEQKSDAQILMAGAAVEQEILDAMAALIHEALTDPTGALASAQTSAPWPAAPASLAALIALC